ncbi:MarR family winged helix-turn-helix transcriptional regulator [Altererythrobacter sp. Root672]|uniref:MarR family winged helix-turn-helix transcriptional regulator n=1 Tax=Altererythrobacter sp. Root672 TaxID=1736584 RepID=UPI001F459919|nr:MarR family transcriptional regulator [Altererythrobacter sp. Root672]
MGDDFGRWATEFGRFYPKGSRSNLEFRLSRLLILSSRRWMALIDSKVSKSTGYARPQWQTLFAIAFQGGRATTIELAERMGVKWPALVRTLNSLEADGLIVRNENPDDRRSRLIEITNAGSQVLARVQPVVDPTRKAVLEGFSEEEMQTFAGLLSRLLDRLD